MKRIFIDLGSMFWPCWHSAKEHDEAWQNTLARIGQIVNIVADGEPHTVSILADSPHNWRHEIDPGYKSNRKDKPPEAIVQLGKAHSALEKLYRVVLVNGYEADDLAAAAVRKWSLVGSGVHLVTCDKDWMQLLGEGVRIFNAKAGTMGLEFGAEFTAELVKRASGVRPDQVRDYLGLMGDASDCIPGVPGIGKVTAGKLLATHDTAQGILIWADGADEGDKIAAKFRDPVIREMFSTSLRLATLRNDADVDEWFHDKMSALELFKACGSETDLSVDSGAMQSPFLEIGDEMREPVNERAAIEPPIQRPATTRETKRETKMKFQFSPATKKKLKCRVAIMGPSKSGKTYTSLAIATRLGKRVAVIDTESRAASKYANRFAFDVLELDSFSPDTYVEAMRAAEDAGYDVIVVDSLSHAWIGKDGALAKVGETISHGRDKNRFTAWGAITPKHNALIDAIVRSGCHVVATMRLKTEYVIEENDRGKKVPRRVGLAPVQREGMEYEFDVIGEMDQDNVLHIAGSRCEALSHRDIAKPGAEVAAELAAWLDDGVDESASLADAFERELDDAKSLDALRVAGDKIASVKDRINHDALVALKEKIKSRRAALTGAAA